MTATPAQELTDAQLRAAWEHCRRNTWPPTFEEAMADELLSRLVRLTAKHPPRTRKPARSVATSGVSMPAPLRNEEAFRSLARRRMPIDRKRAAAGDRDDD